MMTRPDRQGPTVLMTVDAIGGVWRYAMDLAAGLAPCGVRVVFAGLGPLPNETQVREANEIGRLVWIDAPLDWTGAEADVLAVPQKIAAVAAREEADLVHLNLPSQAAGLECALPVVVMSHSCVVTWFAGVRGGPVPQDWQWHERLNCEGFSRADVVVAPSRSHATMLETAYGAIDGLIVVHNASRQVPCSGPKRPFVMAAGRWWDDGKNGAVLDAAAALTNLPVVMAGEVDGPNGQHLSLKHADYRGPLSHHDTMALMRKAAVFASPSIYEPFGLAPLEAARCGAALVLADIPTYRELWDGAAVFVDPKDPEAFAQAFEQVMRDAGWRADLAAKACDRSLDFSPETQADAMRRIYETLLDRSISTAAE